MTIPDPSLVLLIGAAGAGKSTFAHKHFRSTEILSSDQCRALVSDDENDQSATQAAFEVLRCILFRRLRLGRLTVVDATSVQRKARRSLLKMARQYNVPAVAVVLNLAESICVQRNLSRPERCVPLYTIWTQHADLQRSLPNLSAEGFHEAWILNTMEEIDAVRIDRISY
ncbi:MAG TPA: AAA family ATPase [Bryobacteraceae bacterium]